MQFLKISSHLLAYLTILVSSDASYDQAFAAQYRHKEIVGRNKLKNYSLRKQTTLGPMSFCAPSTGITRYVMSAVPWSNLRAH